MTTWDDKPNDYEHALKIIDRLTAELAEAQGDVASWMSRHRDTEAELQAAILANNAAFETEFRLRSALEDCIAYIGEGKVDDPDELVDRARKALANEPKDEMAKLVNANPALANEQKP